MLIAFIFKRKDVAAKAVLDDLARRALLLATKLMEDGDLRNVDPAFLHMLLVGACSFFVTASPLVDALRQKKTTDRTLDLYADFVVDVVLNGLRPRAAEGDGAHAKNENPSKT